jgi:hypothetical protein
MWKGSWNRRLSLRSLSLHPVVLLKRISTRLGGVCMDFGWMDLGWMDWISVAIAIELIGLMPKIQSRRWYLSLRCGMRSECCKLSSHRPLKWSTVLHIMLIRHSPAASIETFLNTSFGWPSEKSFALGSVIKRNQIKVSIREIIRPTGSTYPVTLRDKTR